MKLTSPIELHVYSWP